MILLNLKLEVLMNFVLIKTQSVDVSRMTWTLGRHGLKANKDFMVLFTEFKFTYVQVLR